MRRTSSLMAALASLFAAPAMAQDGLEIIGVPVDGAMGWQPAATELARDLQWLDGLLLVIITVITLFVCVLLAMAILRYNRLSDYSYGTYLFGFPVQQSVIAALGPMSAAQNLAISVPITLMLAFLSCHLVEKPVSMLKRAVAGHEKPVEG